MTRIDGDSSMKVRCGEMITVLNDLLKAMFEKISGDPFAVLAINARFLSLYQSLTLELDARPIATFDDLMQISKTASASPLLRALVSAYLSVTEGKRRPGVATLGLLIAYHRLSTLGRSLNAVVKELPLSHEPGVGLLSNVSVSVKDIYAIEGCVRGNGNPDDMKHGDVEKIDAPVIAALRNAGAEIIATTALLEYAAGAQHPALGEARNPLDPGRTAGGSSGGSASVIGAGICDLALGTDTGGSIRIPAAYCGAIGFKPSFGLLSTEGITPLAPTLDHAGFLALKIELIQRAMSCVVESWVVESWSVTPAPQTVALGIPRAWIEDPRVDPEIYENFMSAVTNLCDKGVTIVDVDVALLEEFRELFIDIVLFEAWKIHGERVEKEPDHFGPETLRLFQSAKSVPEDRYELAIHRRLELLPLVDQLMAGIDALIMPTVPYFAPATTPTLDSELGAFEGLFTEVFNVTGQPAITLPVAAGLLPIGIQLVGKLNDDEALLQVAQFVSTKLEEGVSTINR
jgi:Asp-tRNA(Asn)/Glu-tRNA(Gln) amidotransferase A subunit family amidase